jgi:hypothetical protein
MIGTYQILVGDQMEEDEMGCVCGTCEGQWKGI